MIPAIQGHQLAAIHWPQNQPPVRQGSIAHRDTLSSSVASQPKGICERLEVWFQKLCDSIWNTLAKCFCPKKVARIRALEEQVRAAEGARDAARAELQNAHHEAERVRLQYQATIDQLDNLAAAHMEVVRAIFAQRRAMRGLPAEERAALHERINEGEIARHERDEEVQEALHHQIDAMQAWFATLQRYFQAHGVYTQALERLYEVNTELNIARI